MKHSDETMIKAAWYYYIEGLTQQAIAEKLNLSRTKVIRLLDTARETGLIQFKIAQGKGLCLSLEQKLRDRWNLLDCLVVPTPADESKINECLAVAAANHISDQLTEHSFINMGYGDTASRVLNHLASQTNFPIHVVSLTGGVSYYLPNAVSSVFNARLHLFPTPLLLSTVEGREAIMKDASVKEILRMIRLSSMTIVGIGGANPCSTITSNGIMTPNDMTYLVMKGAVGDILTHFFDKNGEQILSDFDNRLISTPLSVLKELNNVVGVAGGKNKIAAIRAALRARYLNTLITDEATANELLNEV